MREYVFRCVHPNTRKLYYFGFYPWVEFPGPPDWATDYSNFTEQYIGLRDSNGRRIFEGDILKTNESGWIAQCVYNYDGFALEGKNGGYSSRPDWNQCEVIGNIHDTPELLHA